MQRTLRLSLTCLLIQATLIACAPMPAEVADARAKLSSSTSCCNSLDEFKYVPLPLDARFDTELHLKSPVFKFEEGAAYFSAFTLPRVLAGERSLQLITPLGGFLPTSAYIDPVVVFLDGKHQPISTLKDLNLKYGYHGLFKDHHYEVTIPVPHSAEFVVVYGNPTSTRQARAYSDNGTLYLVSPRPIGPVFLHVRTLPRPQEPKLGQQA